MGIIYRKAPLTSAQVTPREQEIEQAHRLYRTLAQEGIAALIGPDGERIDLPPSVHLILMRVVEKMQEGKTIAVLPLTEELSTQQARRDSIVRIARQSEELSDYDKFIPPEE